MADPTSSPAVSRGQGIGSEELLPAIPISGEAGSDPLARPVLTACVSQPLPVARPLRPITTTPVRTERLAVASAACGMTAFVPVISQLLGLWFGAVGLMRIRRARRQGRNLRGSGWAWTGLISSSIALLGWIVLPALLATLGDSFVHTTESLHSLLERQGQ